MKYLEIFDEHRKTIKFALTGFIGYLIYTGLLVILVELITLHYILSAAIAGEISILTMFLIHEEWTFSRESRKTGSKPLRFLKFNFVSGLGGLLNLILLWVFTEYMAINYLFSSALAVITVFIFNYSVNLIFTWGNSNK